jgi:hypothetical protein
VDFCNSLGEPFLEFYIQDSLVRYSDRITVNGVLQVADRDIMSPTLHIQLVEQVTRLLQWQDLELMPASQQLSNPIVQIYSRLA